MFGHGQGSKCAFWDGSRLQTRTALEMEAAIKRSLSKLYDRLVKLADVECGNASSEDAEAVWHMRNQLQVAARHVRSPTAIAGIAKGLLSELGDPERCLLAPADSLPYIGFKDHRALDKESAEVVLASPAQCVLKSTGYPFPNQVPHTVREKWNDYITMLVPDADERVYL